MAKDPAFLFYSSDFLTGTMFMNNEQVGKYIRLLCAQHQIGHLSEQHMLNICGSYDEQVFAKFKQDETGKYYNERCEAEINKRKAYSDSRRANRKSKSKDMNNISKTYVKHMENENENENEIEDINEVEGVQGETVETIGKPNGHRITIKAKYLHERPKVVHDLQEYFHMTGQLDAIQQAGWLDFDGFMKANPGRMFAEDSEVYHSFKKHCTKKSSKYVNPINRKQQETLRTAEVVAQAYSDVLGKRPNE